MKYKCQRYLKESIIQNEIERGIMLSAEAVLIALELSFKGSEKLLSYAVEKYKEHKNTIHGKAKITLTDAIKTIKSPGRRCSNIEDKLDKLYCMQEQYKNILDGLNSLSINGCNTSKDPYTCKIKIKNNSIEIHKKLINISNKIKEEYLNREELKNNSLKDIGVEYKNEYRTED